MIRFTNLYGYYPFRNSNAYILNPIERFIPEVLAYFTLFFFQIYFRVWKFQRKRRIQSGNANFVSISYILFAEFLPNSHSIFTFTVILLLHFLHIANFIGSESLKIKFFSN